jgi:hypothetical protein
MSRRARAIAIDDLIADISVMLEDERASIM